MPSDEHMLTLTLQEIAADRDCWSAHAGEQYRELAHWLRGIAAKCRLPCTQKELLKLARRYDRLGGWGAGR
jgi:hypothetical protein